MSVCVWTEARRWRDGQRHRLRHMAVILTCMHVSVHATPWAWTPLQSVVGPEFEFGFQILMDGATSACVGFIIINLFPGLFRHSQAL
jgi:hypothetical protein